MPKNQKLSQSELVKKWREKIYDNGREIDPHDDYCWESMAVGFAMAHDFTVEEATDFYHECINQGCF